MVNSVWDDLDSFTLDDAAYLWCEMEPRPGEMPSRVLAIKQMLERAIERGELSANDEGIRSGRHAYRDKWGRELGITVVGTTRYVVTRPSLRKLAGSKGKRPKFLFPGQHTTPDPDWRKRDLEAVGARFTPIKKATEKPLSNKERGNLLRTIGALCLALAEKSGNKLKKTNGDLNIAQLQEVIEQVLTDHKLMTEGQGRSHLSKLIPEAIKALQGETAD